MNLAEKINKNTLRFADGITKLPFDVPQFYKDGGEVDLFKNYPNNQGLAQRLPQAGSNAATQSHDLRFQMDKQGKSYMPKPDPYRVNLGQNAAFTPPTNIKPVGPTLVDSNMAAGIANNAANLYQGPFKSQVMDMFPKPQYKYGGKVDPTESGGYGLIQGEGTGKSDDIDATLNQQDYILPIETVNMVGRQWLDDLVARIMGDEQMEGEGQTPEVEARVSDQEYRIPAQVVEELGVEFFDRLKQLSGVPDLSKTVDGKPAYASDGLVEDEEEKRRKELYQQNRQEGQGIVPSYTQAVSEINKPRLDQIKNIPNNLVDSFKTGYQYLFGTKQPVLNQNNIQQQKQPEKNNLANSQEKQKTQEQPNLNKQQVYVDSLSGLRSDNTPQVLYYGEDRFNNSGDVEKDRAIEERQQRIRDYNDQRNASVLPYSEENTAGKYGTSSSLSRGGFTPNQANLGKRELIQNPDSLNRYAANDLGQLYATQGPAADAAYQQQQQQLKDYNAAVKAVSDPGADEQTRRYAQSIIDKYKEKFGVQ